MKPYRLRDQVLDDLESIWLYTLKEWSVNQADDYLRAISGRFKWLGEHPEAGKKRDEIKPGYRSFPEGTHLIFYLVWDEYIEMIGVVHQCMDYQERF